MQRCRGFAEQVQRCSRVRNRGAGAEVQWCRDAEGLQSRCRGAAEVQVLQRCRGAEVQTSLTHDPSSLIPNLNAEVLSRC